MRFLDAGAAEAGLEEFVGVVDVADDLLEAGEVGGELGVEVGLGLKKVARGLYSMERVVSA